MYEFGVTRYFDDGWHVSAGYVYNQNSVPDAYYSPLAADMNRHFFSLGAGRKGKRFDFDVTYQFGYGPARTVIGSTPSSHLGIDCRSKRRRDVQVFESGGAGDGGHAFLGRSLIALFWPKKCSTHALS